MLRKMIWIPKTGDIEVIEIEDDYEVIREKIGCRLIDMFSVGESDDERISYDMICDDEGMFAAETSEDGNINGWSILPYRMGIFRQPLFGNLLMCAIDNDTGDYADMNLKEAFKILKDLHMCN